MAVLDDLSLVRPVLIGHSIAGQELSFVASKHPDRIAGVVYLDAAYRYAYYRPDVREHLQTARTKLAELDAELGKPPRSPDELSAVIQSTLGNSLDELQNDLRELTTTPSRPTAQPMLRPDDQRDFTAYRAWQVRVYGYALPEAELRQVRTVTATGGVGPSTTPAFVPQAISAGSQRFHDIPVPALAIFASPHNIGPWTNDYPDQRSAFEALDRFDQSMTERQATAFERGVASARVVRLAHASHYLFIAQEAAVLQDVRAFLAKLR